MQFSVQKLTFKTFCNVIRFRGNQKYRKHVRGDDIQMHLALQPLYIDETIYQNKS